MSTQQELEAVAPVIIIFIIPQPFAATIVRHFFETLGWT